MVDDFDCVFSRPSRRHGKGKKPKKKKKKKREGGEKKKKRRRTVEYGDQKKKKKKKRAKKSFSRPSRNCLAHTAPPTET